MAAVLEPAAELAVEAACIGRGERVLDVATGTGNAALIAAARGADVTGIDFEPALLALASDRARALGRRINWIEAEIGSIPLPAGAFEAVLSVFGVMYAPDHGAAAAELARLAAPRSRIVLAAWAPGSLLPELGSVIGPYLPPPPPGEPPSAWGNPTHAEDLLAPHGFVSERAAERTIAARLADELEAVELLIRTAGHIVQEQPRLEQEDRWDSLTAAVEDLVGTRAIRRDGAIELEMRYVLQMLRR
jgi:SAM-dependent methyltransferase